MGLVDSRQHNHYILTKIETRMFNLHPLPETCERCTIMKIIIIHQKNVSIMRENNRDKLVHITCHCHR
jgi:hypothetical protein